MKIKTKAHKLIILPHYIGHFHKKILVIKIPHMAHSLSPTTNILAI